MTQSFIKAYRACPPSAAIAFYVVVPDRYKHRQVSAALGRRALTTTGSTADAENFDDGDQLRDVNTLRMNY